MLDKGAKGRVIQGEGKGSIQGETEGAMSRKKGKTG